jgi:iron complex transport system substrate-binding protein
MTTTTAGRRTWTFLILLFMAHAAPLQAQELLLDGADGHSTTIKDASRIVALGGSITETVYALGAGQRLVGVDLSSVYPPEAQALPQLGYFRQTSAEGVLSLNPTLVLAAEGAGPAAAIDQLRAAGVPVLVIPSTPTVAGAKAKLRTVAGVLGLAERGEELVAQMEADLAEAAEIAAPSTLRVLFIYARGAGTLSVSGTDTMADTMIRLAGAQNTVTEYEDYRPLTAEAVVAAAPDVLLVLTRGLESVGGIEGLLQLPGLALTPAGRARRVVAIDDALFHNFGPRLGQAVLELKHLLYPVAP